MKNENLIHVRMEYLEALQSKRDTLYSELDLLKLEKIMKRYKLLRIEELKLKLRLYKQVKEFHLQMRKLKNELPSVEIPEILLKEEFKQELEEKRKKSTKEEKENLTIEEELAKIQEKLNALQ